MSRKQLRITICVHKAIDSDAPRISAVPDDADFLVDFLEVVRDALQQHDIRELGIDPNVHVHIAH